MPRQLTGSLEVVGYGVQLVVGSFGPNGTGTPATVRGDGFSVVRTSQGLFTVTTRSSYRSILSFQHSLQWSEAIARWTQGGLVDMTGRTFQLRLIDGSGNVQDQNASTDIRIHFAAFMATSQLTD